VAPTESLPLIVQWAAKDGSVRIARNGFAASGSLDEVGPGEPAPPGPVAVEPSGLPGPAAGVPEPAAAGALALDPLADAPAVASGDPDGTSGDAPDEPQAASPTANVTARQVARNL